MKKIDIICIDILREQRSNILILVIMTFMMFLIIQSIGYVRYINQKSEVYNAVNLEKSYWVTLSPGKSIEMNDAFKDVQNEKEYLRVAKDQIMKLPHVTDVSFIGDEWAKNNATGESYKILAYDDSMMKIVDVLVEEGETIDSRNSNEVLISKELSTIHKIGDEIYMNKNHEIVGNSDSNSVKLKIAGIVNGEFLPQLQIKGGNIIVCSSELFEKYNIYGFSNQAFVKTDTNAQMKETFNEISPEIGFFMSFVSFYDSDKNGQMDNIKNQLARQMAILIICIISISSLNFAGLYNKKHEYGIYFLGGATMKDIVFMTTARNLIMVFVSTILGFILTIYLSNLNEITERIYDYNTYFLTVFIAIAIYLISSFPIYLELKNQNLIRIIKDVK